MARILAANSNEEVNTRKKHKLPIKAGLSVRYKITPRLSLESGVTYSYLSSELTASAGAAAAATLLAITASIAGRAACAGITALSRLRGT